MKLEQNKTNQRISILIMSRWFLTESWSGENPNKKININSIWKIPKGGVKVEKNGTTSFVVKFCLSPINWA